MLVKKVLNCTIRPCPRDYEIVIGESLVAEALRFARAISQHILIITTDSVIDLLPDQKEETWILSSDESIKSRSIKEKIEDALIERGWGRETCLIAIGGGTILDLVGFVAATYCRGIPYISIPTTLLAMTDAAIGGKTGVNVDEAKNWIGSFHHPEKIFIDLNFLKTLPSKEFHYGLSETIKHSLIADASLFDFLTEEADQLLHRHPLLVPEMIRRSCLVKITVIEQDPYEKEGYRRILNFGHTVGHAIETLTEYRCGHGQAVIMGMLVEAHMAHQMDYLSHSSFNRLETLLKRFQFTMNYPHHLPFEMLKRDKKGAYRFVVLTDIGSVASANGEYTVTLTQPYVEKAWDYVMRHYQNG